MTGFIKKPPLTSNMGWLTVIKIKSFFKSEKMLDFRPILTLMGLLLAGLGLLMFVPVFYDLLALKGEGEWRAFGFCGMLTLFFGGLLYVSSRQKKASLSVKQAFMLTALAWLVVAFFSSLPFVFSSLDMPLEKAYFEAMSGLTTTGATAMTGLDNMSRDILLWRGLLHGLGGVGIIGLAIAVLPMLRIGGMQLFKTESSDKSEKIFSHHYQIALAIMAVYFLLIIICMIVYYLLGMSGFDAFVHAMSTIATGGFSNYDSSFGVYKENEAMIWAGAFFMLCAGMPMIWYIYMLKQPKNAWVLSSQVRVYIMIVVALSLIVTSYAYTQGHGAFWTLLREASFSVISIMTTTGLLVSDFTLWGPFITGLFFMILFIGGSSGSTSGAIKIFRFQILWQVFVRQLREAIYPSIVNTPKYEGRVIGEDTVRSILSFVFMYVATFIVIGLLLQLTGLDFLTAFSGSAMAIGNVGVGLGQVIGPAGNCANLPEMAYWFLAIGMVIGRLEIFTLFVLFTPLYWKS
jgi:trk system potassium uptake protein TrkH